MKKLAALLTAVIMVFAAVCAVAEDTKTDLLAQLNGQYFSFSSGAGGWSTDLIVGENGAFTGSYHDSEMGETGEGYPKGSYYGCTFHGQLSDPEAMDEYSWKVKIATEQDEGQVPEAIEDGIRYVTTGFFGLEQAKTVTVFVPGTPVDRLPEGFMIWSHLAEIDPEAKTIPYYAIWNEADEAGFVSSDFDLSGAAVEPVIGHEITGNIEDGCYVLTLKADGEGEWRADEMAQDQSIVKLASSGVENGIFTARYEPTGDGSVAVYLRHFNDHNVCDELHSYDLLVKDGKVQEVTGGSVLMSPDPKEDNPYFSGEWVEKDTQFTTMNVTKKDGDGWDVEIVSPVSHGSWVIRAEVYDDCDYNAYVYADGVNYNLIPGDTTAEEEAETGLWGTLQLGGTVDHLTLDWYGMESTDGGVITFVRPEGQTQSEK